MKWEERKLGEVLSEVDRSETPNPNTQYRQIGVQLWGRGAYARDTISGAETQYGYLNRTEVGDVIVSKIWARNGSVAVIDESLAGAYASPEFPLFRPDCEKFEPRWFHWFTKTPACWRSCDLLARGTSGKNRIKPSQFLTIQVPLPPMAEQRRIVAKLDAVAENIARIESAQSANAEDCDRVLLAEFHQISEGAPRRPMREVAPLVRRPVKIEDDKEYPELGVRSFGRGTFQKPTLSGATLTWQKLHEIHTGDIVISNIKAWEGAIAICPPADHGRVGSHRYLTFVPEMALVTANWLRFYLLTPEGLRRVGECSPGSADRNRTLGTKAFEKVEIPIPPLEEQRTFDALCQQVTRLRAAQSARAADLAALMPSLLDRAFKGDL